MHRHFVLSVAVLFAGAATVAAQPTEEDGSIRASEWLALGVFRHTLHCDSPLDESFRGFAAPTVPFCEYPAAGDEAELDPFLALAIEYRGPVGENGHPVWRHFAPDVRSGDVNLTADPEVECFGQDGFDCHRLVTWAATYIEWSGPNPVAAELCLGIEDIGQVWIDNTLVFARPGCRERETCAERVAATIAPGVHRVLVGSFASGLRRGFRLAFQVNGRPVVEETFGWSFLGVERPFDFDPPACPDVTEPVSGLACEKRDSGGVDLRWSNDTEAAGADSPIEVLIDGEVVLTLAGDTESAELDEAAFPDLGEHEICVRNGSGLPACCSLTLLDPVSSVECRRTGDGGVELTWENPADARPDQEIAIEVAGEPVATVSGDRESIVLEANLVEEPRVEICVRNARGLPACCRIGATTAEGFITTRNWLAIGPFLHEVVGCDGRDRDDLLLREFLAPVERRCLFPEIGDDVEVDPDLPGALGYIGPNSERGFPFWRLFDDGGLDDGDQDLRADREAPSGDGTVTWLATYLEYTGAGPVNVTACFGFDDAGELWIDGALVFHRNTCGGRELCEHRAEVTLSPGPHRILLGTYNLVGAWGTSFALRIGETPIRDDPEAFPDWVFHGVEPPGRPIPCDDSETNCHDSLDNDSDGFVDCDDDDCSDRPCGPLPLFRRGDSNHDGGVNLADAIFVLNHLFGDGEEPKCFAAADINGAGNVTIASAIYLLNFLFGDGDPPPEPFMSCGADPDASCVQTPGC